MAKKHHKRTTEPIRLPFSYEDLDGRSITLPLYHYQYLCLALEIIEHRLADDEPGCIDISIDPELAEVHTSLMLSVSAHNQWQNPLSTCAHIQAAVQARFLTTTLSHLNHIKTRIQGGAA